VEPTWTPDRDALDVGLKNRDVGLRPTTQKSPVHHTGLPSCRSSDLDRATNTEAVGVHGGGHPGMVPVLPGTARLVMCVRSSTYRHRRSCSRGGSWSPQNFFSGQSLRHFSVDGSFWRNSQLLSLCSSGHRPPLLLAHPTVAAISTRLERGRSRSNRSGREAQCCATSRRCSRPLRRRRHSTSITVIGHIALPRVPAVVAQHGPVQAHAVSTPWP